MMMAIASLDEIIFEEKGRCCGLVIFQKETAFLNEETLGLDSAWARHTTYPFTPASLQV